MKRILLTASLALVTTLSSLAGTGVIADAMKKYHKGETSLCKKVGAGEATPSELSDILKSYEDMAGAKPPKGTPASWDEKTKALIDAVKLLQKGDASGKGKFKMAVNCKACHDVHKGK